MSTDAAERQPPAVATPPLSRTPMAPRGWAGESPSSASRRRSPRSAPVVSGASDAPPSADHAAVARVATRRRAIFSALVLAQAASFAYYMTTKLLPYHGREPIEIAILALSTLLFIWISLGFWTAMSGFALLAF